ncbi:MAG: hypothetical protein QNJ55_28770 [Xenococcus sp. MO_188.B8]|nr:hypothetical protein [Xenococcus sp. MO_188.B8]
MSVSLRLQSPFEPRIPRASAVGVGQGISTPGVRQEEKRKTGLQRLSAEKEVNYKLQEIEQAFDDLSEKISEFEEAGLDQSEIKIICNDFIDIC